MANRGLKRSNYGQYRGVLVLLAFVNLVGRHGSRALPAHGWVRHSESVSKIEIYPRTWHELLIVLLA
jgi:hypothetical protein